MTKIRDNELVKPMKLQEYRNKTYFLYYNYFRDVVTSMFTWNNTMDKKIPADFIESTLFDYGSIGFFEDKKLGLVCGEVSGKNQSMYKQFERYDCVSSAYCKYNIHKEDIVVLKNNNLGMSSAFICDYYAKQIADLERDIKCNINLQKFAIMGSCSEEEYLTYKNFIKKLDDGEPFILKKKNLDIENNLSLFNMKVPFIAPDLIALRDKYKSECFAHFGINYNPSEGKKERLLKDEINSNNEQLTIANKSLLQYRELGCKIINEKFGTNFSVNYSNKFKVEVGGD